MSFNGKYNRHTQQIIMNQKKIYNLMVLSTYLTYEYLHKICKMTLI